jgi:Na+/H+ antiporter NhaD/arsenite permease-like protein
VIPVTVPILAAGSGHEAALPLWATMPFVGMLLSIALFPLVAPRFWHHHYPKISAAWAIVFAVPFLWFERGRAVHEILHIAALDYIPFVILLWGLFTVSGGIVLRGGFAGSPVSNVALLGVGTAIASFVGTTGAAMLLIRPILRSNSWRRYRVHTVVFFIFLVANVGGSLTPLGDPPLFLGFLHGVPFEWTFRLLPETAIVASYLLFLYYLLDRRLYRREEGEKEDRNEPFGIDGLVNLVFLAGIIGGVLLSGLWRPQPLRIFGIDLPPGGLALDAIIVICGVLSLRATPSGLRQRNEFSWEPIREVAILFAGIFTTIIPALTILRAGVDGPLGPVLSRIVEPWHFFWATGLLSSFLDNAPTYLSFFTLELGRVYPGFAEAQAVGRLIVEHPMDLAAISLGAVFMGANTYIGNAPNFMVKSIAEDRGVPMPSFFGYMLRWSAPILLPIFVVVSLLLR